MTDYSQEIIEILSHIHFFASLDDDDLVELSEGLVTVFFKQYEVIFEEGYEADGFYVILSGRVSIQEENKDDYHEISICQKGDYFGDDGLISGNIRATSAKAMTNVVAIHFNQEKVDEILETFPEVIEPIQLTLKSYHLFLNHPFSWRAPRESIHFLARKHHFFLWLNLLPPVITSVTTFLLAIFFAFSTTNSPPWIIVLFLVLGFLSVGWLIWKLVDWSNDFSIITNRRIIALEKVALFYESRQEAPLDAILSVETQTTQLGRWIGYGDVVIRTYTGVITFKKLSKPDLIVRIVNDERGRSSFQSNKLQRISKEDTLRSRIGLEERTKTLQDLVEETVDGEEDDEMTREVHSSGIMDLIADFFKLKTEKNGVITYRTHWFMLIKKALWSGLALFLLFLILVFTIFQFRLSVNFNLLLTIELGIGVVLFFWWLYQFWDWRNDQYIISEDQLIDLYKKPLGQEQRRSAPIKNIQTVEFERQGLISLLLNFGTVFIRVGDSTFTFDYVYKPSNVQQDIFEHYQKYNQRQKQKEKEALRDEVAEWIEIYHEVVQKKPESNETQSDENNSGYNIGEY